MQNTTTLTVSFKGPFAANPEASFEAIVDAYLVPSGVSTGLVLWLDLRSVCIDGHRYSADDAIAFPAATLALILEKAEWIAQRCID